MHRIIGRIYRGLYAKYTDCVLMDALTQCEFTFRNKLMITYPQAGRAVAFLVIGAYSGLAWAFLVSMGIRLLRLSGF
jgi:hypothetical protein